MTFILDLVGAVAKDLGPSASLLLTQQAKAIGKTPATLGKEDLDMLAVNVHAVVAKSLGAPIADRVKANMLSLK
jgi:hypothetical protein